MTPRSLSLDLASLLDHGFGVNYELLLTDQRLLAALAHDDSEQPIVTRIFALIGCCTCGVREVVSPLMRRREDEDRAQRAETAAAFGPLGIARVESRASNGLLEGVQAGVAAWQDLGKWSKERAS